VIDEVKRESAARHIAGGVLLVALTVLMALSSVGCFGFATKSSRKAYVEKDGYYLTHEQKNAILNGNIMVGMTIFDVEASWGVPQRKIVSEGVGGSTEQWCYGSSGPGGPYSQFVYFVDGEMTRLQTVR